MARGGPSLSLWRWAKRTKCRSPHRGTAYATKVHRRRLSAHVLRELIWDSSAKPVILPKRNEAPVACRSWIYQNRNLGERL